MFTGRGYPTNAIHAGYQQKHGSCLPALTGKVPTHFNQPSTYAPKRIPQKRPQ